MTECDNCGISKKGKTEGCTWRKYAADYETEVKEYWLCDIHDKEERSKELYFTG